MVIRFEPKTAKEMAAQPKEAIPAKPPPPAAPPEPDDKGVSQPELPLGKPPLKPKRQKR